MKYKFLEKEQKYDGTQLRSLFNYEQGLVGNSIVCFIGPAEVKEHLVDCEDRLNNDFISSKKMMHFIIEIFDISLREAVVWQRLFISQIIDYLKENRYLPNFKGIENVRVNRRGDDIFIDAKKFSVSIATLSFVSGLIHVGLNINVGNECPVNAIGFQDFYNSNNVKCDMKRIAEVLMKNFVEEFEDIQEACYKVKEV